MLTIPSADGSLPRPTWCAPGRRLGSGGRAAHVLTAVSGLSAPASRLSVERGNTGASLVAETTPASPASAPPATTPEPATAPEPATPADRALTALWQGGLGEDPAPWLARRGWQSQIHHLAALADSYGRLAPANSRSGFVTATYAGRRPHP